MIFSEAQLWPLLQSKHLLMLGRRSGVFAEVFSDLIWPFLQNSLYYILTIIYIIWRPQFFKYFHTTQWSVLRYLVACIHLLICNNMVQVKIWVKYAKPVFVKSQSCFVFINFLSFIVYLKWSLFITQFCYISLFWLIAVFLFLLLQFLLRIW